MLVRSQPLSFQVVFRHGDTIQRKTNDGKVSCFLIPLGNFRPPAPPALTGKVLRDFIRPFRALEGPYKA